MSRLRDFFNCCQTAIPFQERQGISVQRRGERVHGAVGTKNDDDRDACRARHLLRGLHVPCGLEIRE